MRSYPRLFGEAVAASAGKHLRPEGAALEDLGNCSEGRATMAWLNQLPGGLWDNAELSDVIQYLLTSKDLDVGNLS